MSGSTPSYTELVNIFQELVDLPDAEKRKKVETLVPAAKARVSEYEQSLAPLRQQVERLGQEQSFIQTWLEYANVVYGEKKDGRAHCLIDKLPDELLSEILGHLSDSDLNEDKPVSDWFVFGTVLQGVCRRWHGIAMATPALWSNIRVSLNWGNEPRVDPHERHLTTHMQRLLTLSKKHPLDVYIRIQLDESDSLHPALPLLLSSCDRWRTLEFRGEDDYGVDWVEICQSTFPLLEQATFAFPDNDFLNLLHHAPRFRSLELEGTDWTFAEPLPVVFSQMMEIDISTLATHTNHDYILQKFPNAQTIKIHLNEFYEAPNPPCHLPSSCHSLVFMLGVDDAYDKDAYDERCLSYQLESIRVPSVTSLTICKSRIFRDGAPTFLESMPFVGFLHRSECNLTHLTISDIDFSRSNLLDLVDAASGTLMHVKIGWVEASVFIENAPFDILGKRWFSRLQHAEFGLKFSWENLFWRWMIPGVANWWLACMTRGTFKYRVAYPDGLTSWEIDALKGVVDSHKIDFVEVMVSQAMVADPDSFYYSSRRKQGVVEA